MTPALCQAPFKSLRFGQTGKVFVCCHNHQDSIGQYPQESLHQIWKRAQRNDLCKLMSSGIFAKGCTHCQQEVNNKVSGGSRALYHRYTAREDQPVILDFKTDNSCNLSCIMCSGLSSSSLRGKNPVTTSPFHSEAFLQEMGVWVPGLAEVRFSGGEPFLSGFYRRIWELLTEKNPNCKIVVQTNGTVLDDTIKSLLMKGNFHINLSIDSFRPDTYSRIRCGSTLEKVLKNAEWFRDYCLERGRFWGMTSCAMQANKDEVEEIVSGWNTFRANGWFSVVYFPPRQALWTLPENVLGPFFQSLEKIKVAGRDELSVQNRSALEILKGMAFSFSALSEIHHRPKSEYLVPAGSLPAQFQSGIIREALRVSFPEDDHRWFNLKSFESALALGSEGILAEMIEIMAPEEVSSLFATFIVTQEGKG